MFLHFLTGGFTDNIVTVDVQQAAGSARSTLESDIPHRIPPFLLRARRKRYASVRKKLNGMTDAVSMDLRGRIDQELGTEWFSV